MVDLVFTSELALKRSIRKKYPNLPKDAQDATFEDQKQYIGVDVEDYLESKYQAYKEKEQQENPQ